MRTAIIRTIAALGIALGMAACVVYEPYPYGQPQPGPSTFDRSWNAAMGALSDQGVQISNQDRASGMIEGRRGGIAVKTRVATQADGKVRVEFNASGAISEDPGLPDRISRAYDARMGR